MPTATLTLVEVQRNPLRACADIDPRVMFPDEPAAVPHAIAICEACPIAAACLDATLASEAGAPAKYRYGVAGGYSSADRARIARRQPVVRPAREPSGKLARPASVRVQTCRHCAATFEQHGPGRAAEYCPLPADCRSRARDPYWRTRQATSPKTGPRRAPCRTCGIILEVPAGRIPELCDACAPPRIMSRRRAARATRERRRQEVLAP